MDGLVAISQRIAGIEAQLTALSTPPAPTAGDVAFGEALSSASGEFSASAPAGALDAQQLAVQQLVTQAMSAQGLAGAGLGTGLGGEAGAAALLGNAGLLGGLGGLNTPGLLNALGVGGLPGLAGLSGLSGVQGATGAPGAYATPAVLNADGAPADLAHYGNGQIPKDALVPIDDTGHRLWAPAAANFRALMAEASAQGVTIGINDSYRTLEGQQGLVSRLGLYNEGGLAAVPGTSRHGWGLAVDLRLDSEAQAWMRANAERFGFVEDTPREPWHWAFYPDRL